jgi:hypothetical protein
MAPRADTGKAKLEFQSALIGTGLVQPVDFTATKKTVSVICRQVPGQERPWLKIVEGLLHAMGGIPVGEFHVCRRYVLKEGRMVFGWHLGIEVPDAHALVAAIGAAVAVLAQAKPSLAPPAPEPYEEAPEPAAPRPGRALAPGQHPVRVPQPRQPGPPAQLGERPPGRVEGIRVVSRTVDEDTGKVIIEEEMPLPHVYRDLNKPAHKDGRGARTYAGGKH